MPNASKPATTAPALPSLDTIVSVAAADLPATTKAAALTADEIAFAKIVIERGSDGNSAVGPKLADRKEATTAAARVRRLVNRYLTSQGMPASERPSLTTRIVPKDGGSAWAISLTPVPTAEPETPAEDAPGEA